MNNFYKFIVSKEYIDHNGHLTEWGYYAYATKAIWNLNEDHGLLEVYKSYGFGPIMLDTEIKFLKEVFEGDEILVKPRVSKISDDKKKFVRIIEIFNKNNQLSASFLSNGAFLDYKIRKIIEIPANALHTFKKLIIEKI
tara:strand:+ start:158 stop:574 length:417 start_codon:yes stop_codon:yes gene_type:complete